MPVSSDRTRWRIVYDNKNMMVHFSTKSNEKIRRIDVSKFDFSLATIVKMLDANADLSRDVTRKFTDYNYGANRDMIGRAYAAYGISDDLLDALAFFPETFKCQ